MTVSTILAAEREIIIDLQLEHTGKTSYQMMLGSWIVLMAIYDQM